MGIDFVKKFVDLKSAYQRERGVASPTGKKNVISGQLLIPPSKGVPRTTWGDAILVFNHLKKVAEGSSRDCEELGGDPDACWRAVLFVRTPNFVRARTEFDKQNPYLRAASLSGNPGNVTMGAQYIISRLQQTYPYNEEFWGYGNGYAIARSAAGDVPAWAELQIGAIADAVRNLPSTVQSAFETAWDAVPNPIPTLNIFSQIIKWGSIGGGLFLLYWYVLKPTSKKPEAAA